MDPGTRRKKSPEAGLNALQKSSKFILFRASTSLATPRRRAQAADAVESHGDHSTSLIVCSGLAARARVDISTAITYLPDMSTVVSRSEQQKFAKFLEIVGGYDEVIRLNHELRRYRPGCVP